MPIRHASLAALAVVALVRAPRPAEATPFVHAPVVVRATPLAFAPSTVELSSLSRGLLVPVVGVRPETLRDGFTEPRRGHVHEAIDIMAPRGTPIVSATEGRLLRLHRSKAGGLMVYAADASDRFILMYAHLDRYAAGLRQGSPIRRGQVLGYVGTTGNAPPGAPHLHFAIARGRPSVRWWQGTAVNPFPLLRTSQTLAALPDAPARSEPSARAATPTMSALATAAPVASTSARRAKRVTSRPVRAAEKPSRVSAKRVAAKRPSSSAKRASSKVTPVRASSTKVSRTKASIAKRAASKASTVKKVSTAKRASAKASAEKKVTAAKRTTGKASSAKQASAKQASAKQRTSAKSTSSTTTRKRSLSARARRAASP